MVSGKRSAPVRKHAHEAPRGDVRLHYVLRRKYHPEASPRRSQPHRQCVERQLSLDVHLELPRALFKFPGVDATVRGESQVDAVVALQVLRCAWLPLSLEVGRCRDDGHPEIGPDPNGDHVFGNLLAEPDPEATDFAALDAAWEDEPVSFGPNAGNNCKDQLLARVRAGLRPAPGVATVRPAVSRT